MKYMRLVIFLLGFALVIHGQWKTIRSLGNAHNNTRPSMYTDWSNGTTFVAYATHLVVNNETRYFFCFSRFLQDLTFEIEKCVQQERSVEDVEIIGDHSGKRVIVAYVARRRAGNIACTSKDTSGCKDIYITESQDYGDSWTKPYPVPRKNYEDTVERYNPFLYFIRQTNRTFLFYSSGESYHAYLNAVTRPQGSFVFSSEQRVKEFYNPLSNITAAHVLVKDVPKIYLFYVENAKYVSFVTSADNGVNWGNPQALRFLDLGGSYSVTTSLENDMIFAATLTHPINNPQIDLYWWDAASNKEGKHFNTVKMPLDFKIVAFPLPIAANTFGFTGKLAEGAVTTYAFNTKLATFTDQKSVPPMTPFAHADFDNLAVRKVLKALHIEEYTLKLSVYLFTSGFAEE